MSTGAKVFKEHSHWKNSCTCNMCIEVFISSTTVIARTEKHQNIYVVILLIEHLLSRAPGVRSWAKFNKDQRISRNREVYYSQILKEVHSKTWGIARAGQGSV